MRSPNSRLVYASMLAVLIAASFTLLGCPASAPSPPPASSPDADALVLIVEAQQYAAQVAHDAGVAHARHLISDAALKAITASGMALDAAWRDAATSLLNRSPDLQADLDRMAESRRKLKLDWSTYGPH